MVKELPLLFIVYPQSTDVEVLRYCFKLLDVKEPCTDVIVL